MDNTTTIVIIGIYTVIYLVVFFIQRSQINSQKEIIQSMKSFTEIVDLNKLKEYASIIEKSADIKIDLLKK
jgi:hypothetical protein